MTDDAAPDLETLWRLAPPTGAALPLDRDRLPPAARRYLTHAGALGAPQATAVRLRMRGEIRLRGWLPFRAEQVIVPAVGMRWNATVGRWPLRFRGHDLVLRGEGSMQWRLLGVLPVMAAAGPDVDRASVGRLQVELVWLPPALLPSTSVRWTVDGRGRPLAHCLHFGRETTLCLHLATDGALAGVDLMRWGEVERGGYALRPYGAIVEAEDTFGPFTIPTRLRVAWAPTGDPSFEEAEVFRCTVEHARFYLGAAPGAPLTTTRDGPGDS